MQTELQFSIIYPSLIENDINDFDFFLRMISTDDKNIVSVVALPKYSIDNRIVHHIHFSIQTEKHLQSQNILAVIAQLKELENIVCNINLSTEDAEKQMKQLIVKTIEHYGKN